MTDQWWSVDDVLELSRDPSPNGVGRQPIQLLVSRISTGAFAPEFRRSLVRLVVVLSVAARLGTPPLPPIAEPR